MAISKAGGLRLAGINDYPNANRYLRRQYWPQHNRRFVVPPAEAVDFHEPVPSGVHLNDVFCLEYERTVSNEWVVRYNNRFLQIETAQVRPGAKVTVRIRRNGALEMWPEHERLSWRECAPAAVQTEPKRQRRERPTRQPAPDHPWRNRAVAVAAS